MKKIISFCLVLISLINFVYAEQYYQFNINYNKGVLSYSGLDIKENPKLAFSEGGYLAEVVDANGKMLNLTFFSIPLDVYYDNFGNGTTIGGGMIELDEMDVLLQVPYYQNAKSINVYAYENNKLNKKLTIDVLKYRLLFRFLILIPIVFILK